MELVDDSNIFIDVRCDGGWALEANLRSFCSSATNFARRSSLAESSSCFVPNISDHFSSRSRFARGFDAAAAVVLPPVPDELCFDSVADGIGAAGRLWICACDRCCSLRWKVVGGGNFLGVDPKNVSSSVLLSSSSTLFGVDSRRVGGFPFGGKWPVKWK